MGSNENSIHLGATDGNDGFYLGSKSENWHRKANKLNKQKLPSFENNFVLAFLSGIVSQFCIVCLQLAIPRQQISRLQYCCCPRVLLL